MSSLVILCIAIIAVIVQRADSAPSSAIDINQILDLVQQQRHNTGLSKQRRIHLRQDNSDSDTDSDSDDYFTELDSDSDDSDNNRYAKSRKERIIDLIEKVANEKSTKLQNDERAIHRKGKPIYSLNNIVSRSEKYDNSLSNNNLQAQILEQLLSKGIIDEERKTKAKGQKDLAKKRLIPNRLTGSLAGNYVEAPKKNNDVTGLEEYSKVYIVLNPQAVRKSKNKNSLNELVSKVLSLSSPTSKKDQQGKKKPRRYKGFVLKDDRLSRRSRRESKERYAPRDSLADDYNAPKRSRGGGGSLGGHTAIPYIRHRGDIYERDN